MRYRSFLLPLRQKKWFPLYVPLFYLFCGYSSESNQGEFDLFLDFMQQHKSWFVSQTGKKKWVLFSWYFFLFRNYSRFLLVDVSARPLSNCAVRGDFSVVGTCAAKMQNSIGLVKLDSDGFNCNSLFSYMFCADVRCIVMYSHVLI